MLTYTEIKDKPRKFLSMTSITVEEFSALIPIFAEEYASTWSATHNRVGKPRQRKAGGGNKARLATIEDKLLFILVYYKTYPLQTAHGLMFGMSQAQTNEWIHCLSPILDRSLERLGQMPIRDGKSFESIKDQTDAPNDLIIDGTERRKRRPKDQEKQKEAYSGKKRLIRIKT